MEEDTLVWLLWSLPFILFMVVAEPMISLIIIGIGAVLFLVIKGIALLVGLIGWW